MSNHQFQSRFALRTSWRSEYFFMMEDFDDFDVYGDYMVFRDFDRIVVPRDFFEELSETQFFQHFRFYKDDVRRILECIN